MPDPDKSKRTLAESTENDRINPPEFQKNPAMAAAVEPDKINDEIDSTAARGDVRKPDEEPTVNTDNESTTKKPAAKKSDD